MNTLLQIEKPVIGMVHIQPLPGSGNSLLDIEEVYRIALQDAQILVDGEVDALMIENAGDMPFTIGEDVDPMVIAAMTRIASALTSQYALPVGISCVINSVKAGLAIAHATHANFIRCSGWADGYFSQVGFVKPSATEGYRYRKWIKAEDVMILADVQPKNGSSFFLSDRTIEMKCYDQEANYADAVVVTGLASGDTPILEEVKRLHNVSRVPLFVGSGVNEKSIEDLFPYADGFIVGSCFKKDQDLMKPPILSNVLLLTSKVKALRKCL